MKEIDIVNCCRTAVGSFGGVLTAGMGRNAARRG